MARCRKCGYPWPGFALPPLPRPVFEHLKHFAARFELSQWGVIVAALELFRWLVENDAPEVLDFVEQTKAKAPQLSRWQPRDPGTAP